MYKSLRNSILLSKKAHEIDMGSCRINQLRWLNEDPDLLAYLQELGMHEDERVYASVIIV